MTDPGLCTVKKKILLIGFDGISPTFIEQLIGENLLPTFKKISEEGVSGSLMTTIPPVSAPAWSTIVTGMTPGNHGVFDFITPQKEGAGLKVKIHDSSSLRGKAVWDIAGLYGKKSVVINVPLTFPAYPINGVMVSGFPSPLNRLVATPREAEEQLTRDYPEYRIDVNISNKNYDLLDKDEFIEETYRVMNQKAEMAQHLIQSTDWDLFYVVFTMTDRFQHVFWPYSDDSYPWQLKEREKYRDVLKNVYRRIDEITAELMDKVDEDTYVFIISDHGFESLRSKVSIRRWLQENGYIEKSGKRGSRFNQLKKVYKLVSRLGIDVMGLFKMMPGFVQNMFLSDKINHLPGGVFFDNVGIDPEGLDREEMRERLLELEDPETGERVVHSVFFRDELYRGRYAMNTVDMMIVPHAGYVLLERQQEELFEKTPYATGTHVSNVCRKGVFYLHGRNVKNTSATVNGFDIAPTILWLLTGEEQTDMDGKARKNLFTE